MQVKSDSHIEQLTSFLETRLEHLEKAEMAKLGSLLLWSPACYTCKMLHEEIASSGIHRPCSIAYSDQRCLDIYSDYWRRESSAVWHPRLTELFEDCSDYHSKGPQGFSGTEVSFIVWQSCQELLYSPDMVFPKPGTRVAAIAFCGLFNSLKKELQDTRANATYLLFCTMLRMRYSNYKDPRPPFVDVVNYLFGHRGPIATQSSWLRK